jgi:nitronate monooxygenase
VKALNSVVISGKEVLPIIEGGKGIGASNGYSAGAMTAAGGVGTYSGANALEYNEDGSNVPDTYNGKTRREKHEELVAKGTRGGIQQAQIAHEITGGKGPLHINILWEQGGAQQTLEGILEGTKGLVNGVTCGAGMPYKLCEIAEKYNVHYYPIVSSMRAFRALWKRAYSKSYKLLGGVVYEDPWLAGGHNGLSNVEDPRRPEDPYPRVLQLRKFMNEVGLFNVPIIMAGGVWNLSEWQDWIDSPELGPIAFQFGTRPLLTQESPIPKSWKDKLMTVKKGDVLLHRFSPTGFYSSAIKNGMIAELTGREERQVSYATEAEGYQTEPVPFGRRQVFVTPEEKARVNQFISDGFGKPMKTPDETLIFVTPEESAEIVKDQADCMGCLSHCKFSNWKDHDDHTTGKRADPRSFCIQKTLQGAIRDEPLEKQLVFAGHNAYKFGEDSFYENGFIPTVKQLVDRIVEGN